MLGQHFKKLINYEPKAGDLQTFLVFSQHPEGVNYYDSKPIKFWREKVNTGKQMIWTGGHNHQKSVYVEERKSTSSCLNAKINTFSCTSWPCSPGPFPAHHDHAVQGLFPHIMVMQSWAFHMLHSVWHVLETSERELI